MKDPNISSVAHSSTVMTNGYLIQTKGLSISTTTQNGNRLEIKLAAIPSTEIIESKLDKQNLEIRVGGGKSWAKIRFPDNVTFNDLKLNRTDDAMILSGPVPKNQQHQFFHQSINQMSTFPFQNGFDTASSSTQQQQNSPMWFF